MRIWFFLIIAGALASTGCSTARFQGRSGLEVVQGSALPAPLPADVTALARPYVIGPTDWLQVEVYGVEELSRTLRVSADGTISLPLVGTLQAAGKEPAELATMIEDRLRGRYVRNPQVSINATETLSRVITVSGQVAEPGIFPVTGPMTLVRAVARAKGLTEFASTRQVVVFRRVNNQDMAALYDLRAIEQGLYPDPEIYPNDVVVVGDSPGRRLFRDFLQGSGLLVAPIVAILQR